MSRSVHLHAYDPALTETPTLVIPANSQIDWLELENRSGSGTLLFYWLSVDNDGLVTAPPTDTDAWHSIDAATARQSDMRTAGLWLRALSGSVHYVLTAG